MILNQMGVEMVETSETTTFNDRPRQRSQDWDSFKEKKDKRLAEKRKKTEQAEGLLLQFVEDYRDTGNRDLKKTDIKFLEKMDEKVKQEGTISNARQYYSFMKNSFKFYNAMKNFSKSTPKSASSIQYPKTQEDANSLINHIFQIEQTKLETFSEGDPSTEEWIEFMEEN